MPQVIAVFILFLVLKYFLVAKQFKTNIFKHIVIMLALLIGLVVALNFAYSEYSSYIYDKSTESCSVIQEGPDAGLEICLGTRDLRATAQVMVNITLITIFIFELLYFTILSKILLGRINYKVVAIIIVYNIIFLGIIYSIARFVIGTPYYIF